MSKEKRTETSEKLKLRKFVSGLLMINVQSEVQEVKRI